jgi:hypothetical protein
MSYLYQDIMNVPGLSGTWQQRNKDLYYKLGAPMGTYQGNLQQNLWLLNQIKNNNYFKDSQPWNPQPAPVQEQAPAVDPRAAIAEPVLEKVQAPKSFQDVIPQDTWNSVFDEWTRNFVTEYVEPEWKEHTYDINMRDMAKSLENLNKQIGLRGRSGTAQASLDKAADEAVRQEQLMRQEHQGNIANLRNQIQQNWATPLYESEMGQYANSPWRNLNLGDISSQAGIDARGMVGDLASQYNITDTNKLNELIGNLGNWNRTTPTVYDWSVPQGDVSLFNQYKFNQ